MATYHGLWGFETEKSSEIGKSYGIKASPRRLPSWMAFCLRFDSMSPRSDQPRCTIMEYVNRCPFSLNISSLRPVVMHLRLATGPVRIWQYLTGKEFFDPKKRWN